jgi:hypothetical protein
MLALGALSVLATRDAAADQGAAPAATPASPIAEFEFQNIDGKVSFDCATIPGETRLDFLKGAVRSYIANRLNGVHTRHEKDEKVVAWKAYDEASKADPLQSAVPKPEGDRPAAPDYKDALTRALDDLTKGNVRKVGAEPKARKTKDPLVAVVTDAVVREVFASKKAANAKYTYLEAKKEVGADGVEYLNRMIEAKVAGGVDRALLTKMLDEKYIGPAKAMLGITSSKKVSELPSIL